MAAHAAQSPWARVPTPKPRHTHAHTPTHTGFFSSHIPAGFPLSDSLLPTYTLFLIALFPKKKYSGALQVHPAPAQDLPTYALTSYGLI